VKITSYEAPQYAVFSGPLLQDLA